MTKHKPLNLFNSILKGNTKIVIVTPEAKEIVRKYFVETVGSNQNVLN